ncbi:RDD family protein [Metabacillus litoralis]|uniref:RDD family protein n=1 Tax=Metabacillus litoralis TaxID=152268 RepID=A0A5C6W373_9BACI|nr:RDD family protein [Metabacillus litoralis]TXC90300.1 RDD family protein [Metabacillus litoralis]
MLQQHVDIKTPEYVSLKFQPAGLGSRTAALLIDHLILTIVSVLILIGTFILMYDMPVEFIFMYEFYSYPFAITIIVLFVLNWGYFFALEFFYGGKTLGKKMIGIRVIQDNGHSLTLLSSFIRNLLRIIDTLPANYLLGMIMIFFHSKHKRVGDIVAGTIVIHERKAKNSKKLSPIEKEIARKGLRKEDLVIEEWALKSLTSKEWELLKVYSNRILQLPVDEKMQLTERIGNIVFPKIGMDVIGKTNEEVENNLLILYLILKDEWEFEL